MSFRANGTSVVRDTEDGATAGVALAFDPNMAQQIAAALNESSTAKGLRVRTDPLTGKKVEQLDVHDSRPLSEVVGKRRQVRIVGPYATATMDTPGGRQIRSLTAGAVLPGDVTAGQARHLVDVGLAEVVETGPARKAPEGAPAEGQAVEQAGGTQEPDGRPAARASKDDWVAYAVSQRPEGQSEEDARAEAEAKSKADLVAQYGG